MEFLFDNPFILMILIGLISTLFGKKGEQQEQQKRPQQRRPSQQPRQGPGQPAQQRPERRTAQQRPERPAQPVPPSLEKKVERTAASIPQLTDVQKIYEDKRREINESARHEPRTASGAPASVQAGSEEKPVTLDLKPDGNRLIEGIAWAQVLGPPRARDPHRTMRRR
jgi:FtsZ-interacting cell division protein YlmF